MKLFGYDLHTIMLELGNKISSLNTPQIRKKVMVLASLVFITGIALSLWKNPTILNNINYVAALKLFVILMPIHLIFMSFEIQTAARLAGKNLGFLDAAETTIMSTAANMFPIPGSAMVKIARFKALGISIKEGTLLTLFIAVIWMGGTLLLSGLYLTQMSIPWALYVSVTFILGGAGLTLFMLALLSKIYNFKCALMLIIIRLIIIVIYAFRLWLCFAALDISIGFAKSVILTLSDALGAIIIIVPSGLGISEIITSVIGMAIEIAPEESYLSATLNRLLGLSFMITLALLFLKLKKKRLE